MIHAGTVLDLGDDIHILASVFVQEAAKRLHILPVGYEGGRHIFDALADTEEKVGFILLAEEYLV